MHQEAQRRALSPLVHRAVVGLGVAVGAAAVAPAPPADASPAKAASPRECPPDCAPADPESWCDDQTPEQVSTVRRVNLAAAGGQDLGEVILQYSAEDRCVRAVVGMDPAPSGCQVWAGVYKPTTNQTNAAYWGAPGAPLVATHWVNDAGIQQKAQGVKVCGGQRVASGATGVY